MRAFVPASILLFLAACGPNGPSDGGMDGTCPLTVEIGPSTGGAFVPYVDGEEAPVVLGFQGFQMLRLDVRVVGAGEPSSVELSAFVEIPDTGVMATRLERDARTRALSGGVVVEGFLLFFNDAPLSLIGGHDATVEVIARSPGCVGGVRRTLRMSDMPPCIDPDATIPDAGFADGGLPDGSVVCGAM
jgi:hypothetical protein